MKEDLLEEFELPEGVSASYANRELKVNGKNEVARTLFHPSISISASGNKVTFKAPKATKREKKLLYTMLAHTKNMTQGAQEAHTYQLKVCSGHFPMNVSIGDGKLTVKNFLGEAVPRVLKLKQGAEVNLDGDIITVTSPDLEVAGQQAGEIEQLTKITNRDRRIFQDGIYITMKNGRVL